MQLEFQVKMLHIHLMSSARTRIHGGPRLRKVNLEMGCWGGTQEDWQVTRWGQIQGAALGEDTAIFKFLKVISQLPRGSGTNALAGFPETNRKNTRCLASQAFVKRKMLPKITAVQKRWPVPPSASTYMTERWPGKSKRAISLQICQVWLFFQAPWILCAWLWIPSVT